MREINIEGYSPDEILGLPDEQLDLLALSGEPLVLLSILSSRVHHLTWPRVVIARFEGLMSDV